MIWRLVPLSEIRWSRFTMMTPAVRTRCPFLHMSTIDPRFSTWQGRVSVSPTLTRRRRPVVEMVGPDEAPEARQLEQKLWSFSKTFDASFINKGKLQREIGQMRWNKLVIAYKMSRKFSFFLSFTWLQQTKKVTCATLAGFAGKQDMDRAEVSLSREKCLQRTAFRVFRGCVESLIEA